MIRRPPRSTLDRSSAASDVYKRQLNCLVELFQPKRIILLLTKEAGEVLANIDRSKMTIVYDLSLIHISEPTRPY